MLPWREKAITPQARQFLLSDEERGPQLLLLTSLNPSTSVICLEIDCQIWYAFGVERFATGPTARSLRCQGYHGQRPLFDHPDLFNQRRIG